MNQVQCTLFPLGLSRLCPHLSHQFLQITTIPIIKQHDCKYNQDSWHKQSLHYLKRKFSTYNSVTLGFELSSSHTYSYIPKEYQNENYHIQKDWTIHKLILEMKGLHNISGI